MCYADLILFYRFQVEETAGNGNDLFINDKQQVTGKTLIKKNDCVQLLPARVINQRHTPDHHGI